MIKVFFLFLFVVGCFAENTFTRSPESAQEKTEQAWTLCRQYILGKADTYDPAMLLLVLYAEKRYEGEFPDSLKEKMTTRIKTCEQLYCQAFRRIVEPGFRPPPAVFQNLKGIDLMTSRALYCEILKPGDHLVKTISDELIRGTYYSTHASLALGWLTQNGCINPDQEPWKKLIQAQFEEMKIIFQTQETVNDLVVEAMAMLCLWNREDLIPAKILEAFLQLQLEDGSFPALPEQLWGNEHTTALAFWVLSHLRGK